MELEIESLRCSESRSSKSLRSSGRSPKLVRVASFMKLSSDMSLGFSSVFGWGEDEFFLKVLLVLLKRSLFPWLKQ